MMLQYNIFKYCPQQAARKSAAGYCLDGYLFNLEHRDNKFHQNTVSIQKIVCFSHKHKYFKSHTIHFTCTYLAESTATC